MTTGPTDLDPEDVDPFDVDLDVGPSNDPPDQSPVAGPADPLFADISVAALAGELIGPAVRNAVGRKVDDVATAAIAAALTPDILNQLRAEADEAAQTVVRGDRTASAAEEPRLYYGSTDEFIREYLRHIYKRKIDGHHTFWAPQWWRSAEAIARLEAMWRAWEHLRLDPSTGPSVWWLDHADPHMRVLMHSTGPFSKDLNTRSSLTDPLPYEAPPDGLFPDVRDVESQSAPTFRAGR